MSFRRALAAIACLPALLAAQTPRTLRPVAELTIDAATADLRAQGTMAISRAGDIMVSQRDDRLIRTFSATGTPGVIGRNGEGPGEFRNPTRIGFIGDSLWVLDPSLNRVTLFGPDRKVTRTLALPISGMERERATAEDSAVTYFVQAMLPGGGLRAVVGVGQRRGRPAWATVADSGWLIVVALTAEGRFRHRIMVQAPGGCQREYRSARSMGSTRIPFCFARLATDWDGGVDVGVAEPIDNDTTRYRIGLYGADGRVRFTKDVPFTPIPVSRAGLDSARRQLAKMRENTIPDLRSGFPAIEPNRTHPPVRRVVSGRDGTLWVSEETGTPEHRWRIYDARGVAIGTVALPADTTLAVAERGRIWAFTTDADGLQGIVRYRLQ